MVFWYSLQSFSAWNFFKRLGMMSGNAENCIHSKQWLVLCRLHSSVFVKGIEASRKMCSAHPAVWPHTWWRNNCFCSQWHFESPATDLGCCWCWGPSPVSDDDSLPPSASFQSCSGSVVCFFASWQKERCLALDRALISPFIQAFWSRNDLTVFMITTS